MLRYKHQNKWLYILIASIALCLVALCAFIIWTSVKYGSLKEGLLYLAENAFSDFGQLLYFTISDNPYTTSFHTMYTPLNFLFYLPFALICRGNEAFYRLDSYVGGVTSADELAAYNSGILQTWEFWVCLLIYYVAVFTILFFIIKKSLPFEKLSRKLWFYFAVGFSTLIGFGFVRGSNIFIALAFFAAYVKWYNSDKRWKRELSLVFFAIAGTMKFYLLFGGILLLKDKRWLDVLKCVLYVFLCVFVPFFIYDSPFDTMVIYLNNLFNFASNEGRIGVTTNISVYNLVYCFFALFDVQNTAAVTVVCWVMTALVFIAGFLICIKTKSFFSELMAMCCVFALVSPVSYLYVLSFLLLPFIVFEGEKQNYEKKRRNLYNIIFFILMFIPLIVFGNFFIFSCVLLVVLVVEMITAFKREEEVPEAVPSKKKYNQNKMTKEKL